LLQNCDEATLRPYRPCRLFHRHGDLTMRMLETVTSSLLAIAAQALVVGVVVTIL
jgi:hypothetical protein